MYAIRSYYEIRIVKEDGPIVDGICVKHTPVHTKGGLTVFIDTPKGKAAITGFCIISYNFV